MSLRGKTIEVCGARYLVREVGASGAGEFRALLQSPDGALRTELLGPHVRVVDGQDRADAGGCLHLADSDEPDPKLMPKPCPNCGRFYVNDDNREESPRLTAAQAAEVRAESDQPWSSHPPRMARVVAEGKAIDETVAMSLDRTDYIQRAKMVPGIKNSNGAIPQPPAGEAWMDGFSVGWSRRAAAGDAGVADPAAIRATLALQRTRLDGLRAAIAALLGWEPSDAGSDDHLLGALKGRLSSGEATLSGAAAEVTRIEAQLDKAGAPAGLSVVDRVQRLISSWVHRGNQVDSLRKRDDDAARVQNELNRQIVELEASAQQRSQWAGRIARAAGAKYDGTEKSVARIEAVLDAMDRELRGPLDVAGVPDDVGLGPIATLGRVRLLIDERNKLREAAAENLGRANEAFAAESNKAQLAAARADAAKEDAEESVADLRAIHARLVQHGAALPEGDLPASILAGIDSLAERAARTAPSSARADWWRGELLQALGVGDADAQRMNGALIDRVRELARQVDAVVVFRTEVVRALGWNPDATVPTDYEIARVVREQRIARERAADTHRMLRARLCDVLRFPAADAVDDVLVQAVADQRAGLESARSELDLINKLCHGVDAPSVVECVRSLVADRTEHRLRCEELTRISAAHAEGVRLWRAERPREASTLPPTRAELVAWLLGRISDLSAQLEGAKAETARRDAADKELHRMLSTVEGGTVADAVQSLLKSRAALGGAYEEWVRAAFQHGINNPGDLAAKLAGARATFRFRDELVRALGWTAGVYSDQQLIQGVIDRGRATAGRPMTAEEATAIAREAAFSTTPRPSYVQGDPAKWLPHEWVIAAIRRAAAAAAAAAAAGSSEPRAVAIAPLALDHEAFLGRPLTAAERAAISSIPRAASFAPATLPVSDEDKDG